MEQTIAKLEERQRYNEKELSEVKAKIQALEANMAVLSVLASQVERLAQSVDKLNAKIETMEIKSVEKTAEEYKAIKTRKTQMIFNVLNVIVLSGVTLALTKLGLK